MLPHTIGLIGEILNFLGAVVLALDIFLRRDERGRRESLEKLNKFAKTNSLLRTMHRGVSVSDAHFAESVLELRAAKIAYLGVGLLAAGFLFLVGYHLLEMVND